MVFMTLNARSSLYFYEWVFPPMINLILYIGLSDPYCRLGILNEEHREKHIVQHKDLEEWQRERLVESIASTTIKPATLEPEWDEDIRL